MIKILSLEKALGPLTPGVFLFRENRFTAYVKVSNSVFKAHVSDTGRLKELLIEGREVLLSANPNGKLDFKLVAVKHEGEWVLVNTALHSKIAERLLKLGVLGFIPKSLKKEVGMKLKTLLPAALSVFLSAPVYAATGTTSGTASSIPLPSAPDMTPVYGLAGILLSAGVGLFAVRKVIKLMNRS